MKKRLQDEFIWLKQHYPLVHFQIENLKINEDHPFDAFVLNRLEQNEAKFAIFLLYDKETSEEKIFHALYHEYGHLVDLYDYNHEYGTLALKKILDENAEEIAALKKGNRSHLYKELKLEMKANQFADKMVKLRKGF